MYAVIKLGGNQHRASVGDVLKVQKLDGEVGSTIEVSDVLLVKKDESMILGKPLVAGAKVLGEIIQQGRDKTVLIYKFKRTHNYRRKNGHRQMFTKVRITDVVVP